MNVLSRLFVPRHLRGYCTTAKELRQYWAVEPSRSERRDAGLRFLTTVGQHLASPFTETLPLYLCRYPHVVSHVSGEIAKVEDEITKLVGDDTRFFGEAFLENLWLGSIVQRKFFHTSLREFTEEMTAERGAAMLTYYGPYIPAEHMSEMVRFILATIGKELTIFVNEQDTRCILREFELANLFASRRPEGPLTQGEIRPLIEAVHSLNKMRTTGGLLKKELVCNTAKLMRVFRKTMLLATV